MSNIEVKYDGYKATISNLKVPPSTYWELKEEQKESIKSLIIDNTLPITEPDNPLNSGLLMYKKISNDTYEVLTGLLPRLSNQYRFQIMGKVGKELPQIKPSLKPLRNYQEESVNKILKYKRGIISIATGGGKTRIISELINQYKREGLKIVVLVPTINLLYQMVREIGDYNEGYPDIGRVGGGKVELDKEVTVAIPDTLYSRRANQDIQSFLSSVDILLVDEVHLMMSPTCCYVYSQIVNSRVKVGFSATPQFNLLMEGLFGPILHQESPEELIKKDVIECPEVIFYKVKPKYLTGNLKAWVDTKNIKNRWGGFSSNKYSTLTNELIIKHKIRNTLIVDVAEKALAEGRGPLIIVVSRVDSEINHPDYLLPLLKERLGIDVPVIKGSNSNSKKLIEDLREGRLQIALVGPKIMQVGTDVPNLNCVILANEGKEASALIQQIGRALRGHESKVSTRPLIVSFEDTQFPFVNQARARWDICVQTYGKDNVTLVEEV